MRIQKGPSPEYALELIAEPGDIDELGHVSNIAYVRWVQEAAKAHSIAVGWDYAAYARLGAVFVVRRHEIEYLAQAFVGDRVQLVTHVASWAAASSVRETRVVRLDDDRELVRAKTLWAFVSAVTGRPTRIPAEITDAFARAVAAARI